MSAVGIEEKCFLTNVNLSKADRQSRRRWASFADGPRCGRTCQAVENPSPRNLATSLPKRYGIYMPRARSLVLFCLPFLILIPLSLLLQSTCLVDAVNSLLASDSTSPRQQPSASPFSTTINMLHYEQTPVMPSDHIAPSTTMPMPNSASANSTIAPATAAVSQHRHIWIITGPAGCGKTSVAEYLAATFSMPYLEGDSVSLLPFPSPAFKTISLTQSTTVPPTSQH